MDTCLLPCFALADEARQAVLDGHLLLAIQLLDQARETWDPAEAPTDEEGNPELFWPYIWEGSLMTLGLLAENQPLAPPASPGSARARLLDSLMQLA